MTEATESVEAVHFSFLTDEETKKHSFVKITNPILLDSLERPVPGGLYDPALGPLDDRTICRTCGQRSFHCPGHCGHIDLVSPIYNPLLFDILFNILQRTCSYCHHFKAGRGQVGKCVSQLENIIKGDIVEAKRLDFSIGKYSDPEDSDGSYESCSMAPSSREYHNTRSGKSRWTSLQLAEAMSVLGNFLKCKYKKCKNCDAESPKISKPTFGWFHMNGLSDAQIRANIIRGSKLEGRPTGIVEEQPSSGVEDADDACQNDDSVYESDIFLSTANSHRNKEGKTKRAVRKGEKMLAEYSKQKTFFSGPLLPSEVEDIMRHLWENEAQLCSYISNIQGDRFGRKENRGYTMFFLGAILVPPLKFRPPSKGRESVMEHPQTVLLGKVLQCNISLGNAHVNNLDRSKLVNRWIELQQSVNVLFDSKTGTAQNQREIASGICQLLEKKEGIFRQKMMGKRVNYACRSVISPDPYLAVNEIGIPPYFALRLTYPERVTPWNVAKLRNAVINGPDVHPGATHYADKLSTVKLPSNNRKTRITYSRKLPSSRGVVTQTGKNSDYEFEGKQVYRHLEDGDIVLVNRQPTLHKPSIMAHVVRVLKGEKTLRMHYANCSTYNADFDGDEMNVHFPQDEISRAEAYNIVNANNQYTVPTRGDPIRGLIQDHIVSSVLLTKKDTFLDRDQFNQLLYSSGISCSQKGSFTCKPGKKVVLMDYEDEMSLLAPAILKPKVLWTGKQVITAVLNHITKGKLPFTVEKEGKISGKYFASKRRDGKSSKRRKSDVDEANGKKEPPGEETLLIYKNVLVRGVIDKGQFGNFGLVHIVQELYGSNAAGTLLSAFSRLFTVFLQMHGFTCGVDDLLLLEQFDKERKQRLEKCDDIGFDVHSEFVGCRTNKNIGPKELQMRIENVIRRRGESAITWLDGRIRGKLNAEVSEINKDLFLIGLWKSFPKNCFSLMTATGAKGSMVNFQQVSSLLGQQDLEGKRVPRMVSGKTLPCFIPWDWTSRAGGFICDNFLSGLRPQEYYFHCMAGREGLVDTAVKTSRSGYLQRCLIKNLESLKVCYDHTVRDADGSVVQFLYGEDGVDVHQTGFLAKLNLLEENYDILEGSFYQQSGKSNSYIDILPEKLLKKGKEKMQNRSNLGLSKLQSGSDVFFKLMEYKYFSSLAQPGEPVGVIAAQSVGEPSTQMTLNTFHLAGRGDMNVTLGIPRLQEILMTASSDIKTPIMTCPLQIERSKSDADRLATKLMNVTLADIIESIGVSVVPFAVSDKQVSSVYKLTIKLYDPQHHLPESGILLEDCGYILEVVYLRELEDAIHNHLVLVSRISGIRSFTPDSLPRASNETDRNAPAREGEENGDDGGDGIDVDDGAEDFGSDAQKRKRQATDEMDYEDGLEDEPHSEVEVEKEVEHSEVVNGNGGDGEDGGGDGEDGGGDETFARSSNPEASPKPGTAGKTKKTRAALSKKKTDRSFSVKVEGVLLEVQFKFTNEPHVLLTQIAQKAAGKVYLKRSGKIDQCMSVDCGHRQVIYYGEDPKARNEVKDEEKQKIPALQAAGLDFTAFWKMQDDLDIRYVYTNNIHAMLNTYGVEAAREAIIREVQHVFNSYGISVDVRHLSLIADFMTHSGGYQPMSRTGGIAESISPLSKMSFETASKFIVQAAFHGLTDNLESPSARICLGLPVKGGTGCFDLLQEIRL